jgi:hypothetical protein
MERLNEGIMVNLSGGSKSSLKEKSREYIEKL